MQDELISTTQAAKLLGVNRVTLGQWLRDRQGPPAYRLGNEYRIRRSELEAWLEEQRVS